jgi:hypothetical protein
LLQATAGNPLFVDGALRMLIAERRKINADLPGTPELKVPDTVTETSGGA